MAPLKTLFQCQEVDHAGRLKSVLPEMKFDLDFIDPDGMVSQMCGLLRWSENYHERLKTPGSSVGSDKLVSRILSLIRSEERRVGKEC